MVAGLATLQAIDEEGIVQRAAATGELFQAKLAPLVERYEMLHEVTGLGLMIGLGFGPPTTPRLLRRWNATERVRPAMSTQSIVVPLFHRHRILTQVAADNVNIIKLLPPLICGEAEVDAFVEALDDVLASAHKGLGLLISLAGTMAKGALPLGRRRAAGSAANDNGAANGNGARRNGRVEPVPAAQVPVTAGPA
jgi:ornithine--oxo-acid transaminase